VATADVSAAMDKGGRWCLAVVIDGSCGSSGRWRWRLHSLEAMVVVFNGGSSVRRSSMAPAMDYDEMTRGWRKERQRNNKPT
jgi:hypothetical protein